MGATNIGWVAARDATDRPTMHRAVFPTPAKGDPVPTVNSAEGENPSVTGLAQSKRSLILAVIILPTPGPENVCFPILWPNA